MIKKLKKKINNKKIVSFSDLVRFIILYIYGGIYIDADTIILRDLKEIYDIEYEWAYRWSFHNYMNTAVLRLRKESEIAKYIIKKAFDNKIKFHPKDITKYLRESKYIYNKNKNDTQTKFLILPTALFDPLWNKHDGYDKKIMYSPKFKNFDDVFKEDKNITLTKKFNNFLPGAYTYHWHNHWNEIIHEYSWLGIINKEFNDFLCNNKKNVYGELILDFGIKTNDLLCIE